MEAKEGIDLLFVLALAAAAAFIVAPSMKSALSGWNDPTITPAELAAAKWADANTPPQSIFACDLFACEMLTAAAYKVGSVGGAWELSDRPNERYMDNQQSFLTESASEAHGLLAKYGIRYVFVTPARQGFYAYGWKQPSTDKYSDARYFEKIYDRDGAYVFRVK